MAPNVTTLFSAADHEDSLNQSCSKKCIPPEYRESELNRGESICLDRCVAKFFEVTTKVGEKMQNDQGVGAGGGAAGGNYSA